ncbi:hypothetical protein [Phenylobacterium sp.]|uniref:hypothetical protein n=1 Tax=Phenylobacterium sp. TaxID=1871053 RepID=UPI003001BC83
MDIGDMFLLCSWPILGGASVIWDRRTTLLPLAAGVMAAAVVLLVEPVRQFAYEDQCFDLGGATRTGRCDYGTLRASAPSGWRSLPGAEAQVALGLAKSRKAELQRLYEEADFDGDGRLDEAAVLIDEAGRSYSLFVFRQGARPEQLTPPRGQTGFADVVLSAREGDPQAGRAAELALKTQSGRETFVWDPRVEVWRPSSEAR